MLSELRVRDFAIIDDLTVRFAPGLTILTGETGAGKSILVGALSFALGEKVSSDVIRRGAAACRVEASFVPEDGGRQSDSRKDGNSVSEGKILLAREIARDGKSRCQQAGKAVPLSVIRDLGNSLVDFHGQHEHQVILAAASHIDFLDDFACLSDARMEIASLRHALLEAQEKAARVRRTIDEVTSKQDFMNFEINQIASLNLRPREDSEIEEEIDQLENAEKIIQAGSDAAGVLYEREESAINLIARAKQMLEKVSGHSRVVASLEESLDQAHMLVKDVAETLRDSLSRIELDASRLEYLRERAVAIEGIKRKFGKDVDEVLSYLTDLRARLESKEDLEAEAARLDAGCISLSERLLEAARRISRKRKAAASRFEKAVETELGSLGMEGGAFRVVFERVEEGVPVGTGPDGPVHVGDKGMDNVEFFIRTNKGEDLMPLRRIASGGEVSRVMLALKRILANVDKVGTLVFDEIDSGIGGTIAGVVASKLREVARARQVICITHLPQIAAAADLHLAVGKTQVGGRTITRVSEVKGQERVGEIARMIAGSGAPKTAWVHAEEMLRLAASR
jgi:DNA repair protein RecN (Recombination protein N)